MEIVQLGSLYLNGEVRTPGTVKGVFETPSIGDTVGGHEIQWVKDGERLIADRCIVQNITWNDLDVFGFIFGCPVLIDGKRYLCRSLKGGALPETPNEWDDLLKTHGGKESLWHWQRVYFWCQEDHEGQKVVRGSVFADRWRTFESSHTEPFVGFRPVLEPLSSELVVPGSLVGKIVKVHGPRGMVITGMLKGVDDYDLTLHLADSMLCPTDGVQANGEFATIDLNSVLQVQEVKI